MDQEALLQFYDTPDPSRPGVALAGYDRDHARRTAAIVMQLARDVGIGPEWLEGLEAAAILHDLGRAGLDPALFAAIFDAAREEGLPLRLPELRLQHPELQEADAQDAYLTMLRPALERRGIAVTSTVREHVAMRMDYRGRLREMLRLHAPQLQAAGVAVEPWMEKVVLYYYYPHLMAGESPEVRRMGMLLVACENFEAMNNARRGRDYYRRADETMRQAFETLASFCQRGLVDADIVRVLACAAASGALDPLVQEARGNPAAEPLPPAERAFLEGLCQATVREV